LPRAPGGESEIEGRNKPTEGEKGRPKIKTKTLKENDVPVQRESKKWKKKSKKRCIKIDRVEYREVDRSILPPDAEYKSHRSVIKQNIRFETDNVEYLLERYYSLSKGKVYEVDLPEGVKPAVNLEAI
jgi:hypothetical protein